MSKLAEKKAARAKIASQKFVAARANKFASLVQSSFNSYEAMESKVETFDKRAALAESILSSKDSKNYTSANLKKLSAGLVKTSKEISNAIVDASNKLDVSYICSIKSANDKDKKVSAELISGLSDMYDSLHSYKAQFNLLSKRVAAEVDEMENDIPDEVFMQVDENGYVNEPEQPVDEIDEFNRTFNTEADSMDATSEATEEETDESEEDEKEDVKKDAMDTFDDTFDSAEDESEEEADESEEDKKDESKESSEEDEIYDESSDVEGLNSEDLDDDSILDDLEDIDEDDMGDSIENSDLDEMDTEDDSVPEDFRSSKKLDKNKKKASVASKYCSSSNKTTSKKEDVLYKYMMNS